MTSATQASSGGTQKYQIQTKLYKASIQKFVELMRTILFLVNIKVSANGSWTAFTYRHPEGQCGNLGLGGREGAVMVGLFGSKWTTADIGLATKEWHSLCLTWSNTEGRPLLYVNGNLTDLEAGKYSFSRHKTLTFEQGGCQLFFISTVHLQNSSTKVFFFHIVECCMSYLRTKMMESI